MATKSHEAYQLFIDGQTVGSLFDEETWSAMPDTVKLRILEITNTTTREEAYAKYMETMRRLQNTISKDYPFVNK